MDNTQKRAHSLCIKGETTVTGVTRILSIDEKEAHLAVGERSLLLTGRDLHAEKLSLEEGVLVLSGEITTVKYSEKSEPKSILKRIFK